MYEYLIKVDQNGVASRTPLPANIYGFPDYVYQDLTFLGIESYPASTRLSKWLPQEFNDWPLGINKKYGDEILTPDFTRNVVIVSHAQIDMTPEEIKARDDALAAQHEAEQVIARQQVDEEATRRINLGFTFLNHPISYRSSDRTEILSNAQIAFMAVVGGVQDGNLRWADDNNDFVYIAADNVLLPMDAKTTIELHRVASARRRQIILEARELKLKYTVPSDYQDNQWWP